MRIFKRNGLVRLAPMLAVIFLLGLASADVSGQVSLEYCGSTLWSGWGDVEIDGRYIYCTAGYGLSVIDATTPSEPFQVSQLVTRGSGQIAIWGSYLCMAAGAEGMHVIDISDPSEPRVVGNLPSQANSRHVEISGQYAYLADGYGGGFKIVDMSDPSQPQIVGRIYFTGDVSLTAVSGSFAYVVVGGQGLVAVDISVPSNPVVMGKSAVHGSPRDMEVRGDYLYMANACDGIEIFDISDPSLPVSVEIYNLPGMSYGITLSGRFAYVAEGTAGIYVLDVGDPTNPVIVSYSDESGEALGIAVKGGYAYVADRYRGLTILDVVPAEKIHLEGSFIGGSSVNDVVIADNLAYVANGYGGLAVADISDLNAPFRKSGCSMPGFAEAIATAGDRAFTTDFHEGYFHVVDLTDPNEPDVSYFYWEFGFPSDVAVLGEYVYTAVLYYGLRVYHIAPSGRVAIVGSVGDLPSARTVAVTTGFAFVGCGSEILVFDISNPASPKRVGTCGTPGLVEELAIHGNYVLAAEKTLGLQIVDVSDPTLPELVGSCGAPDWATGVVTQGDYAYVASGTQGVFVVDISEPASPVVVGVYDTPGDASNLAVVGDYVFVADRGGLIILRQDMSASATAKTIPPAGKTLFGARNYPNPFNPSTTIQYNLPERARVEVAIYNLLGQRVVALVDEIQSAGVHDVVWNGRDERGNEVATGIYLYRIDVAGSVESKTMVLVK